MPILGRLARNVCGERNAHGTHLKQRFVEVPRSSMAKVEVHCSSPSDLQVRREAERSQVRQFFPGGLWRRVLELGQGKWVSFGGKLQAFSNLYILCQLVGGVDVSSQHPLSLSAISQLEHLSFPTS